MQNQAELMVTQLSEVVETARSMAAAVARTCDLLDSHLARISTGISTAGQASDIVQMYDKISAGHDVHTARARGPRRG